MQEIFLYTAYLTAITVGFPTDVIQNVTRSDNPIITKLNQGPRMTSTFSKPRISASNMYRSSPFMVNQVNPIDNLLLYLLLSAGRDFSEEEQLDQQREQRRRSPDPLGDFISEYNKATVKVTNGTNATPDKIEDLVSKVSEDDQETHNQPMASEGTCMCFNRVFRSRPNRHFEPIVRIISTSSSSDQNKPNIKALQPIRKATASVSGWRSNHTTREDVTQQSQQILDDSLAKTAENGTRDFSSAIVRVLRVADLIDDVKNGSPSPQRSSPPSQDIDDDMILELQQGVNEETALAKKNTENQPLYPQWLESIRAAGKVLPTYRQSKETPLKLPTSELTRKATTANETTPSTDKTEDDGYYFLSYSGDTENRTTANRRRREHQTYDEENTEEDRRPPPFGPFRRLQQIAGKTTTQKSKKGTQTTTKVAATTKHPMQDVAVQHLNTSNVANETKLANATKFVNETKTTPTSTTSVTTTSTTTRTTPTTTTRTTASTTTKITFRNHPGVLLESPKDKRDDKALKIDHKLIGAAKKKQETEMVEDEPEVPDAGEDDPEASGPAALGGSPRKRQGDDKTTTEGTTESTTEGTTKGPEGGDANKPVTAPVDGPGARAEGNATTVAAAGGATVDDSTDTGGNETTTEADDETIDPNLTKDKDTGSSNLVMVTVPTAIGLLVIVALCCYCTRPGGAFCYNFLRKPGQPTRKQKNTMEAEDREVKAEQQAAQKKGVLKASADQKQQKQKMQMQKERGQQRTLTADEKEQARVARDEEKKLADEQKQKEKELAKKESARIKKETEKAKMDAATAKRKDEIKRIRDKARAKRGDDRSKFDEDQGVEEKLKEIAQTFSVTSGPPKQRPGAL